MVGRDRSKVKRRYFRADTAFANPDVYEFLVAEGFKYAICPPANPVIQEHFAHLLKRPIGRPPNEVRRFSCQLQLSCQEQDEASPHRGQGGMASGASFVPALASSSAI